MVVHDTIGIPFLHPKDEPMEFVIINPYKPPVKVVMHDEWYYLNSSERVRLATEYELIQKKQSNLSRRHRDAIVKRYKKFNH